MSKNISRTDAERASDADYGIRSQVSFTSDKINRVSNDNGFGLPNLQGSSRDD